MVRVPGWSQVEPDPSTITTAVDPPPTTASESETLPPLVMLSVPLPSCPTKQNTSLVHVEPEPETVAVPVEPALCPSAKSELETVAPPVILSDPEPSSPIYIAPSSWRLPAPEIDRVPASPTPTPISTWLAAAPLDVTCARPPLFISAIVLELGTPADQFAGVNQFPVPSVQTVWARIGVQLTRSENNAQRVTLI